MNGPTEQPPSRVHGQWHWVLWWLSVSDLFVYWFSKVNNGISHTQDNCWNNSLFSNSSSPTQPPPHTPPHTGYTANHPLLPCLAEDVPFLLCYSHVLNNLLYLQGSKLTWLLNHRHSSFLPHMIDLLDVHSSIQGSAKEAQLSGTNGNEFRKAGDGGDARALGLR